MGDIKVIKHSDFEAWKEAPVALIHVSRETVWRQRIKHIQEALHENRNIEAFLALDALEALISQDFISAWRLDGEGTVKELEE